MRREIRTSRSPSGDEQRSRKGRFALPTIAAFLALSRITVTPTESAGLPATEGGRSGDPEVIEHSMDVTIHNGFVVTDVNRPFGNLERPQVATLYAFAVSCHEIALCGC